MPDVATDTLGPGDYSLLAAAGWDNTSVYDEGLTKHRRSWTRPPGETAFRERIEHRNALIAAIEAMGDIEMSQVEESLGLTVDSLPASIFPAVADSRWTGGFAYAPENQYAAILNDVCGQLPDVAYLSPSTAAQPTSGTGTAGTSGHLAAGAYSYLVVPILVNGGQGTPSAAITATTTGSVGDVALAWTAPATSGAAVVGYAIYGRTASSYTLIGTSSGTSFTDTGAAGVTFAVTPPGNLPQVGYVPFLIQVQDECSTIGWKARDFVGRALRLLDNATPNAIEREFWSGAFAQNTTTGPIYQSDFPAGLNAFLTQTGTPSNGGSSIAAVDLTPTGGPPSITRGMQILEDYLANAGFGGQGMIHVAPQTSPNLLGARRLGALLLSVMDNIIVPGSGYPTSGAQGPIGNGAANASATTGWMFASDLVSVRLDDPMVFPSTYAEALDRPNNVLRFRAQRYAAVTFDNARLAAVRVELSS